MRIRLLIDDPKDLLKFVGTINSKPMVFQEGNLWTPCLKGRVLCLEVKTIKVFPEGGAIAEVTFIKIKHTYRKLYNSRDFTWVVEKAQEDNLTAERHNERIIMETTPTFGWAVEMLKERKKVARKGWNGKGMHLFLKNGFVTAVDPSDPEKGNINYLPHICMLTAQGDICVGWLASQADMLSNDWCIVE